MSKQSLLRKARVRKKAIIFKEGKEPYGGDPYSNMNIEDLMRLLDNRIDYLEDNVKLEVAADLRNVGGVKERISKIFKRLTRKVFRKILGWYYIPAVEQLNVINDMQVQSIRMLRMAYEKQNNLINELRSEIVKYKSEENRNE